MTPKTSTLRGIRLEWWAQGNKTAAYAAIRRAFLRLINYSTDYSHLDFFDSLSLAANCSDWSCFIATRT